MKNLTSISVLLLLFNLACTKVDEGEVYISQEYKNILPQQDTIKYVNQDKVETPLMLFYSKMELEEQLVETDVGIVLRTDFYADAESLVKRFNSQYFQISYYMSLWMNNAGKSETLTTKIKSNVTNKEYVIVNEVYDEKRNPDYYEGFDFVDSLRLNDTTLYNLYLLNEAGNQYYFQKGKGVVVFDIDNNKWNVSN